MPHVLTGAFPGQRRTDEGTSARIIDRERPDPVPVQVADPVPDPASEVSAEPPPGSPLAVTRAMVRSRAALGLGSTTTLSQHTVVVQVRVDADGCIERITQRTGWCAQREGADSFPVAQVVPVPVTSRPEVEALEGCEALRSYTDLREGVFTTLMRLPEPLHPDGPGAWTVHEVRPATGAEVTEHEQPLYGPVCSVRIEVEFDPERLPVSGSAHVTTEVGGVALPLNLVDGTLVWSGTATEACRVGVRWRW